MIIQLIFKLKERYCYIKTSQFPPYIHRKNRIDVKLDLSNYATKSDLKNAAGVDTSQFGKKDDLATLESEIDKLGIVKLEKILNGLNNLEIKVDKLDVDKMVPVPTDLSMLSVVVKNGVVKKDVYDAEIKDV